MINVRVLRVGSSAVLLEFDNADDVEAWRRELWRRRADGDFAAADIVAGARVVLVDGCPDVSGLARAIDSWPAPRRADAAEGELVTIPIRYDGDDLGWVASQFGLDVEAFVAWHLGVEFRVAFCGFAPGFAYLASRLWTAPRLPRLPTPRPRVPAGSVGLADAYCGIYPTASPGGWRLIGTADAVLFDPRRPAPALLTPGTRVRFARIDASGAQA
jgi:KipI family sensor histidine kinase inhibitor